LLQSSSASRLTVGASGRSVHNCMWWFENGQCNGSDAVGRLSLWWCWNGRCRDLFDLTDDTRWRLCCDLRFFYQQANWVLFQVEDPERRLRGAPGPRGMRRRVPAGPRGHDVRELHRFSAPRWSRGLDDLLSMLRRKHVCIKGRNPHLALLGDAKVAQSMFDIRSHHLPEKIWITCRRSAALRYFSVSLIPVSRNSLNKAAVLRR